MKKAFVAVLCIVIVCSFVGCGKPQDVHIPDTYISSDEHWEKESFQDYTDFCIYRYDSSSAIEADSKYEKVTEDDIERVAGYFTNFEMWMKEEKRLDEYSFDQSCITAGDLWYVKTKEGQPIGSSGSAYGKYDNYTVYFFDVESLTLYFIHSNI